MKMNKEEYKKLQEETRQKKLNQKIKKSQEYVEEIIKKSWTPEKAQKIIELMEKKSELI
jgi:hypothetical protein